MKKILLEAKNKKNYIVVITIGNRYYKKWQKKICPIIKNYCESNKIGLIAITNNLIDKSSEFFKKPQWQKLLVGQYLLNNRVNFENICIIDGDILINPFSPNIFNYHKKNKISVVSSRFNMPYDWQSSTRKISFYRKKFYSKKYALNSAINMTIKDLFKYHKLKHFDNFFCAGMYMFNKNFSKFMEKVFFKYKNNVKSITNGGDQTHVNYEFQSTKKINWLDYKFQALWNYEMANYYPFLYYNKDKKLIQNCIESSLSNNYFLHFAGSSFESDMIDSYNIKFLKNKLFFLGLNKYLKKNFTAKASGFFKPKQKK